MNKNNKFNQLGHVLVVVNLDGQQPNLDEKKYTTQRNFKTK
jgi:hypothetical protein